MTRNDEYIKKTLKRIENLWKKYPNLRLGQLLLNAEDKLGADFYFLEDDSFLYQVEKFYKTNIERYF